MPKQLLRLPLRARLVVLIWVAALGGAALAALYVTQGLAVTARGGGVLAAGLLWLWWYLWRYQLHAWVQGDACGGGLLCFARGRLLRRTRMIPYHGIYTFTLYTTPLLRWAGCSFLICHTLAKPIYLPPFADEDLAPLLRWLREHP